MTTFVLVHGAWGGAHSFRHVRRLLQAEGHQVYTPSLTGVGERVHLASPLVNLSTHVRDVSNHILYEDLQDIVLVGFSYGGLVVSGALEHIADRVAHLVYLDAFVPRNGESAVGLLRGEGRSKIELGEDWLMTGPVREYADLAEGQWMTARRTTSRTYIKATQAPVADVGNDAFWRAAKHAASSAAWRYFEVDSNHMLPSNKPNEIAQHLLAVQNTA
jgi:pimeloyl-ACP methyl ester carboxylesterase